VTVAGHRISIRLEPSMWDALTRICERERKSIRRIHRQSHNTTDTQFLDPRRLIINTLGLRNPKIVSGGSTAS